MKYLKLFEEHINEIGDASSKPFKVKGPSPKQVVKDMLKMNDGRTNDDKWLDEDQKAVWEFDGDKGQSYTIELAWNTKRKRPVPMRFIKNKKAYKRWEFNMNIGFYAKVEPYTGDDFRIDLSDIEKERTTNLNEQYRILSTVIDTVIPVINEAAKEYSINTIYIIPKADYNEPKSIQNKRGKFYLAYLKKNIKKINVPVTAKESKYDGGFIIQGGHSYTMGGEPDRIEIRNESLTESKFNLKAIKLAKWYIETQDRLSKEDIIDRLINDEGYDRKDVESWMDKNYDELKEFRLNEIGDRSVEAGDWIQSKYEKDHKGYTFMTKDEERYYAYFEKKPKVWLNNQGLSFKVKEIKDGAATWETSFGHVKGHIHGYGGTVDFKSATNKGSHFEILSTYAEILEDFLKKNKGKVDIIIAKPEKGSEGDNRRLRLYQAFLQKTKIFKKVETIKVFGREIILLYI